MIAYMQALHHFRIPKIAEALTIQAPSFTLAITNLFSLILCILPLMLAAKLGSQNLKAFFTLGFSYNRVNEKGSPPFQWVSFLEHHVRRRSFSTLEAAENFDLEGLIEHRFVKFWQIYAKILMAGCMVLALAFILERYNFSRVFKDRIEVSPFTSFSSKTYTRDDIVGVERNCHIRKGTERYPGPNVKLSYRLKFKDGKKLDIIRGNSEFIKSKTSWALYWQSQLEPSLISPLIVAAEDPIAPTKANCKCAIMNPSARRAKYAHKVAKLYSLPANREGCDY